MAEFAAMAVQEKAKKLKDNRSGGKSGRTANKTGIPVGLKERMETASGISLSDVKIHYNSDRPAKVGALAYAQGDHVYMGRGQERYLPHELGHVIQQRMGIVKPTTYNQGLAVNDAPRLERQADEIGRGVVQRIRGPVGDGKASNIVQMTTIHLKEVKGKDTWNKEIVGLYAEGDSKGSENLSFGGFQGIQSIFASKIHPKNYIRNADIGWGTIGNVWENEGTYSKALKKMNNRTIAIHTRS